MKQDYGQRLLAVLRKQRDCTVKTLNGSIITNRLLYDLFGEEISYLQVQIGRENKRKLLKEAAKDPKLMKLLKRGEALK